MLLELPLHMGRESCHSRPILLRKNKKKGRYFLMSDNTIILQPKYVADFQCDGSKCNAKCCGNKWRIGIDVDTYKKYQRIKNPVLCYAKIIYAMFNVI